MDTNPNYVKILENLFLGTNQISNDTKLLKSMKITHLLCVGSGQEIKNNKTFTYMLVEVQNSDQDKLLFNFDSIYEYIDTAINKGKLLVFCLDAKTISPVIIIAYLIRNRKIGYDEALELVKLHKPDLELKENHIQELKELDGDVNFVNAHSYHCILCRRKLFEDVDIDFKHTFLPKDHYAYKRYKKSFVNTTECTSYFLKSFVGLDPAEPNELKLNCLNKNCKNKLGDFCPKGSQCSCGSWVVPAIQIPKSKVDKVKLKK